MKEYKPTDKEIFDTDRYTIIKIPYGSAFLLPIKEATVLLDQLQKAELVKFDTYDDDSLAFDLNSISKIETATLTKNKYQKAKIKALLLFHNPPGDITDEIDK